MFSGVFIAEKVDRKGDKGTRDTTIINVQILWRPFSTCSCNQPVSFMRVFFSGKEYCTEDYLPEVPDFVEQMKGMLLYLKK